jgi:hypothetical protein
VSVSGTGQEERSSDAPAYTTIRGREALAKLPEEEQRASEMFWDAVEATRTVIRKGAKK